MKRIPKVIFASLILLICIGFGKTFGQEENLNYSKFGIGVSLLSLNDLVYAEEPVSSIYLPINVSAKFRIEPEIGFLVSNNSNYVSFSLGLFGLKGNKDLLLKYGLRVGTMNGEYFHISPTIGGEYFLSKRFSLGAEAQIRAFFREGYTLFTTGTSAAVRFYF